jgi:hypothetical protein
VVLETQFCDDALSIAWWWAGPGQFEPAGFVLSCQRDLTAGRQPCWQRHHKVWRDTSVQDSRRCARHSQENFDRPRGAWRRVLRLLPRGKVVDLWGGVRRKETGEPWERDTMVVVHSAVQRSGRDDPGHCALARLAGLRRASGERTGPSSPGTASKTITVRQLLAHQAGLFAFDEPVDRSTVADPDRLAEVMARHKPAMGTWDADRPITGSRSGSTKAS